VRCDVLILAAFHPELAALRAALGEGMCGHVADALVVGRAVGVGISAAAAGAATSVCELQPRVAVAIGTCGAYRASGLVPGDIVVGRRICLVDAASAEGLSEFPEPMSVALDADASTAESLSKASGGRPVGIATTLAITVDDETAARIALASDSQVEHLEAHGVATACASRGIPFGALFGVANVVGAHAREQWNRHHRLASQAAADAVLRWLRGGWSA
jgi:nucleoside phosphorylase